jgi:hypothetical protein
MLIPLVPAASCEATHDLQHGERQHAQRSAAEMLVVEVRARKERPRRGCCVAETPQSPEIASILVG